MNFEQRIFQYIKEHHLTAPRESVLIGVSGGADSMALLLALVRLRHDLGIQLHAVHFNHKFRPESGKDEGFVVSWCKQLGIPLTVGKRQGSSIKHLSEDDARKMRFEFFDKSARGLKIQKIALAHTRNDLAETVLMRLMRGSGLYGLRAILPQREIGGISFVRPLLGVHRRDVEEYLKLKKMPFCVDSTNQQKGYERNKVRLDLLPLLAREYNPQIINALSDLASTASDDYEFLSMQACKQFDKAVFISKKEAKISVKKIQCQHPAIKRLIFRKTVEKLTEGAVSLTFEHVHALENLALSGGQGELDLPNRLKVKQNGKYIQLTISPLGSVIDKL